jgi:rfaE bifunctional protein kinase chain/domain
MDARPKKFSAAQMTEILPREFSSSSEIAAVLDKLSLSSIAVVGDFCLDAYWMIDPSAGEVSLETGLMTHPVTGARYAPGGAGNVVLNLVALEVSRIFVLGVVGDDPFGRELYRLLDAPVIDRSGLLTQARDWQTHTYAKPHLSGKESNRIDFGNFNRLSKQTEEALLGKLEEVLSHVSAVLINEQVTGGIHTSPTFRSGLNDLMNRNPHVCFVIDSRKYHESYPNAVHKLNEGEVMHLVDRPAEPHESITVEELLEHAETLHTRWGAPLVITRGANGCVVIDGDSPKQIFPVQLLGTVDPVGAGDSFVSALAAIVASGCNLAAAAFIANLAGAVSVQKLFQTGTASPAEIIKLGTDADYIYRPELARAHHAARYLPNSELEVVEEFPESFDIRYAIFDHDGTISTLREGWEIIMEPMMLRAIFGGDYSNVEAPILQRAVNRVKEFIDRTTGIQTIVQMHGLIEIVREFGCVPKEQILDAAGYKHVFNVELKALVAKRLAKLESGELEVDDFTMKGAVAFLRSMSKAGVKLYLASGTDDADTKEEAGRLGYADVFDGGIYGSVGDVSNDAKKVVIERILRDVGGAFNHLVTFGDGPVEMRESVKRGGYAVGVASDEVRRFGMNFKKRTRLVRSGAKVIVPDFSQRALLWEFLRMPGTIPF